MNCDIVCFLLCVCVCLPAAQHDFASTVDSLLFIGPQLVALSSAGKVAVWNMHTSHWKVQQLTPITSHDTAGSSLLLGCANGKVYYIGKSRSAYEYRCVVRNRHTQFTYVCSLFGISQSKYSIRSTAGLPPLFGSFYKIWSSNVTYQVLLANPVLNLTEAAVG